VKRAAQLFVFEELASGTPHVEKLWRTTSVPAATFISVAETHWEIVVTRQDGAAYLSVLGPQTAASTAPIPQDAEIFGIQFKRGAFMPDLPVGPLVNAGLTLPAASSTSFWLDGSAWELPTFENADVFVRRLVRRGLLVEDPVVEAAVAGRATDLSLRSVQRRVLRSTGLTLAAIRQIDRARRAATLLEQGLPIAETVGLAGYADHAHLTRSLKRFIGQTPREIGQTPSLGLRREPTD
jgi:AraC-like DNA-binding protein